MDDEAEFPRFRIAVPTRSRPVQLEKFIEALVPQLQRHPEFNLVIVNDGSHDERYQAVIERHSEDLTYLQEPERRGIGPTRHRAIDGGNEEYIVTADDDCLPGPFWLDWIKAITMANPHADIIAGFTDGISSDDRPARQMWTKLPGASPASAMSDDRLITAVAANAVFRRPFYESVTALELPLWYDAEDYHQTRIALSQGASYLVCPWLKVAHPVPDGFGAFLKKRFRYGLAAAEYAIALDDTTLLGPSTLREIWANARRSADPPIKDPEVMSTWSGRIRVRAGAALAQLALDLGRRWGLIVFPRRLKKPVPTRADLSDKYAPYVLDFQVRSD